MPSVSVEGHALPLKLFVDALEDGVDSVRLHFDVVLQHREARERRGEFGGARARLRHVFEYEPDGRGAVVR